MPPVNTQLENLFRSLETQRTVLLGQVKTLSIDQFNHGRNNKWSISQIIGHLVQAERMSVGYMTKKINAINEVGNTGLWGEIVLGVFIISQRLPLKYKAPQNLGEKPPAYSDVIAAQQDWDKARQELRQFLETVPANGLKKKIYRHPVMSRCNVVHALKFFREHIIHHKPQILRQL